MRVYILLCFILYNFSEVYAQDFSKAISDKNMTSAIEKMNRGRDLMLEGVTLKGGFKLPRFINMRNLKVDVEHAEYRKKGASIYLKTLSSTDSVKLDLLHKETKLPIAGMRFKVVKKPKIKIEILVDGVPYEKFKKKFNVVFKGEVEVRITPEKKYLNEDTENLNIVPSFEMFGTDRKRVLWSFSNEKGRGNTKQDLRRSSSFNIYDFVRQEGNSYFINVEHKRFKAVVFQLKSIKVKNMLGTQVMQKVMTNYTLFH